MASPDPAPARAGKLLQALPSWLHVSDIQGLAQLATQGVLGITGLAESVQGNVYKAVAARLPGGSKFVDRSAGASGVTPFGITGLIYGSVRGITRLAGGTVNAMLSRAVPLLPKTASSPTREAMLSAINGVLGDRLQDAANPLAITMSLREGGQTLVLDKASLVLRFPVVTGKVLVYIHGLCMNDLQWGAEHSKALAMLGYTSLYLHYNTGLHVSTNGAQLAALLQQLLQAWPQPVEDLGLVAHSMGGLVARSAAHQAEKANYSWRGKLKNMVFLGTPHHGAPLERVGNWVDVLLGSNVVTRPFAAIGKIRSSGLTDLRYGYVLTSSWEGKDRFQRSSDSRAPLPLPEGVKCFAVAATTLGKPSALNETLVGDGLVPLRSALGQHDETLHCLAFEADNQWVAYGVNHMALLKSPDVAAQVQAWLSR